MAKTRLWPLLLALGVVAFGSLAQGQQGPAIRRAARPIANQYIVVMAENFDAQALGLQTQALYNGRLHHVYRDAIRGFSMRMTPAVAQLVARDPQVAFVEEDGLVQINDVQVNPPSWGLDRIDQLLRPLDNSYTYPPIGTPVHVHVIDTGILPTHVDFGGRASVAGDFIDDDGDGDPNDVGNDDAVPGTPDGVDCHGHGTHVSGTIGGTTYGVAKNSIIHGYRAINCGGLGPLSSIIAAIDAVVADGRRPAVANMSLGGGISTALDNAVRSAISTGVTFVVAAGNDAIDASLTSPARVAEAITVGATDINDVKPGFSNFGSVLDVFAPGVSIRSTYIGSNSATAFMSGTSMAAPHVAGVAALYLEQNGHKTPQQVRDVIVGAATPGVVSSAGGGSPNRLLYSGFTMPVPVRTNVAAAASGGVASASSVYSSRYPASALINGDRRGSPYGGGGTWCDASPNVAMDWVEIAFAGSKTIDEIDVFMRQDNYGSPVEPTPSLTCVNCVADFTVLYLTGTDTWQAIPNGVVRNNTLVWRSFLFAPVSTSKIRVLVERTPKAWSELAEIEAYASGGLPVNTPPTVSLTAPAEGASAVAPALFALAADASDAEGPVAKVQFYADTTLLGEDTTSPFTFTWSNVAVGNYTLTAVATDAGGLSTTSAGVHVSVTPPLVGRANVAAAANGGVASASSFYSTGYPASAVNNGDRRGFPYGGGGVWSDATINVFPDWVEIAFAGLKSIDEVDVFLRQDNSSSPEVPTATLACTTRCALDFTVQYWTGGAWQAVPNGVVRNNALVWRQFVFGAVSTTKVRVLVERAPRGWSELAEIEAYGTAAP